ncbi:serine/threonine-protein kinase [Spirillospora sp. CA-294931]|uniref:serine/threonine-protein kinase n=1 Tax=Spirillospora sp. CA-294931 TaxID=3240042 RepID=UPI003D90AEDA
MGAVYLGLSEMGQRVAIKVIRRELATAPSFRARFETEVRNAQRVASFCTARVLAHGDSDGVPYLVTEYIDGPSLGDHIERHGAVPDGRLRSLAIGIATALTAIHAVRLVHRDLKPRNVMLSAEGPRVIDFGIARALDTDDHHTQTGGVVGSPGWSAPEQVFNGHISTAIDVFAWGSLIAYAAAGKHPYGTGNLPTLAARAQQRQYDLTGVPAAFLPLIHAALDPDPTRRPTAENILIALVGADNPQAAATSIIQNEWQATAPTAVDALPQPVKRGLRRSWVVMGLTAGFTALAVGGTALGVALLDKDDASPATSNSKPTQTSPAPSAPAPGLFTRIKDPCGGVPRALAEELVPGSTPLPTENVADGVFGNPGIGTGCSWREKDIPQSRVQKVRTLAVELVSLQDGGGESASAKTLREFISGRNKLQERANGEFNGARYGTSNSVVAGDDAFSGVSVGPQGLGRITGGVVGMRYKNLIIEVRYGGGDLSVAKGEKPDEAKLLPLPEAPTRAAAERVAKAVAQSLTDCPTCFNE